MTLVDHLYLIKLPHIEGITVRIIVPHGEVQRLLRVPAETVRLVGQESLAQRRIPPAVIQYHRSIDSLNIIMCYYSMDFKF